MQIYYLEIVTKDVDAVRGGELAHPPVEIPGFGTLAIYL